MAFSLFGKKKHKKDEAREAAAVEATPMEAPSLAAPRSSSVLQRFFISEKSARGIAMNQYTFVVNPKATKTEVRDAVKRAYKVDVVAVNMVRLPSKALRVGRYQGRTAAIKKAIVTLKEGQTIAQAQA